MNNIVKQAIEQERAARKLMEAVREDICKDIEKAEPMPGVKVTKSNLCVAIIRFSTVSKAGSFSPEFYIPKAQAALVSKKLSTISSISALIDAIQTMVEKRQVTIGKETNRLNPKTVEILSKYLPD